MQRGGRIKRCFLPVYTCIPQTHRARLCPKWQRRCHRLCPRRASSTCNIINNAPAPVYLRQRSRRLVGTQKRLNDETYLVGLPKPMLSSWETKENVIVLGWVYCTLKASSYWIPQERRSTSASLQNNGFISGPYRMRNSRRRSRILQNPG